MISDEEQRMVWTVGLRDDLSGGLEGIMSEAERLQRKLSGAFDGFQDYHDKIDAVLDIIGKGLERLGVSEETAAKALRQLEAGFGRFVDDVAPARDVLEGFAETLRGAGVGGADFVKCMVPLTEALRSVWEPTDKAAEVFDGLKGRLEELGVPTGIWKDELDGLEKKIDAFTRSGEGAGELLKDSRELFAQMVENKDDIDGLVEAVRRLTDAEKIQAEEAAKAARAQEEAARRAAAAKAAAEREARRAAERAAREAQRAEAATRASVSRLGRAVHLATGVMSGNLYSLTRALTLVADKFKFLGLSAGIVTGIGAIGAAVGGVVATFQRWKAKADEVQRKLSELREADFTAHLAKMRDAQRELNDELAKTVSGIDKSLALDQRELELAQERIKAQIELNRQKALEGKDGEDAARINREADALLLSADRQAADARLSLQIAAAQGKADALRKILEKYDGAEKTVTTITTDRGRTFAYAQGDDLAKLLNGERIAGAKGEKVRDGGLVNQLQFEFNGANADEAAIYNRHLKRLVEERLEPHYRRLAALETAPFPNDPRAEEGRKKAIEQAKRELELARRDYAQRVPQSDAFRLALGEDKDYARAKRHVQDLKAQLETATAARDRLKEAIADAESREDALWDTLDTEERKADIAVEVERRKQDRLAQVREEAARKEEARALAGQRAEAVGDLGDAGGRLMAAREQVATAWGWYRDKRALRGQIREWEADAKARARYAEDYRSLTHGRAADLFAEARHLQRWGHEDRLEERIGEWRRKKMLSLNEEATMRVALAQDEERRAGEAVESIDRTLQRIDGNIAKVLTMEG